MAKKGDKKRQEQEGKRSDDSERLSLGRRDEESKEEHEFEFKVLVHHEEKFDPKRWVLGMEQKRQMPRATLETPDPGAGVFKREGDPAVYTGAHADKVKVRPSENPQPNGSFGFVGSFATLETNELLVHGTLALRFNPEQLGPVVRHSLRLFYWDKQINRFTLVSGSRVSSDGDYVYSFVTRPGQYAIIGINADPLVLPAMRVLCAVGSLGIALPDVTRRLIDPICKVILCSPDLRQALENPQIRETLLQTGMELGFPLPPGNFGPLPGGGDLCERCLGMGGVRLPECDILDPGPVSISCPDYWESVGPKNLSGCIKQVHIDPTDSNRIYCAAMNGGVWVLDRVSAYPSTSWRPLTDQLDSLRMNAVSVAPSDGNVIYAASPYIVMYRSEDRGGNWLRLEATRGWKVHKILIHPSDRDTLFVATESGFRVSTDGGVGWTLQRNGDVLDAAVDPLDSSILYIGVRNEGILKSVTAGFGPWTMVLPWSSATSPATTDIRIALGERQADGTIQSDANRTVIAKFSLEIFVNHRGGRSSGGGWVSKGSRGMTSQLWWDNVLAVNPFDPAVILTGEQELNRSADGGDTWNIVASYYAPHEDQQSVQFDRNNQGVVYLSNDGGVYRSTDGGQTWYVTPISVTDEINARRSLVQDLGTAEFYRVGVQGHTAVGNLFHSGIIASNHLPSARWQGIEGHAWEFNYVHADPKRIGRFYVFHSKLARRRYPGLGSDDFLNIAEFRPYLQGSGTSTAIGTLAVDKRPGSNIILVGAFPDAGVGYCLMMTTEGDREPRTLADGSVTNQPTWAAVFDNGADPIVSVIFAPVDPAKVYAISGNGKVFRKDNIDSAGSWDQPGQWAVGGVRQMAVNSLHPERLYAITSNKLGRSIDGGINWMEVGASSLPASEFNTLIADSRMPTKLYLGADIGVFVSYDEGDSWLPYDAELPNAEVLQIFSTGDYLYAVTHGRGLWRRRLC